MSKTSNAYIALGDSMSIDLYPEYDARERVGSVEPGLGAASLFFRNVDSVWAEFSGKDLRTRFPDLDFENRTSDGAMIATVAEEQLRDLGTAERATIATLTVGGNDLLAALWRPATAPGQPSMGMTHLLREVARIQRDYAELVAHTRRTLPNALLILATIYDPTDGTGLLLPNSERLPIELLKQMNERIRVLARSTPRTVLADVNLHFIGHGVHVAEAEQWYWRPSPIEPSARGASEIRRLFWDAIGGRA